MIGRLRSPLLGLWRTVADRLVSRPAPRSAGAPSRRASVLVVAAGPMAGAAYYPEILRAEGITSTDVVAAVDLDATELLGRSAVVVVGQDVDDAAVELLQVYLEEGGCVVAMRPPPELGPMLGLEPLAGRIDEPYISVMTAEPAVAGITAIPMQVHGSADRWRVVDAVEIATLVDADGGDHDSPGVTVRTSGSMGGRAITFTYDLARSVVLTRQGNPEWAGQNRDGDLLIRSSEMFFGAAIDDPQPDWVDGRLLAVPQADEQQRLFVNLMTEATAALRRPLPRFWYLPHGHRAAVVMTGDDHGTGGTVARFEHYRSLDRPGARDADWECVRATSYVFPRTPIPWRKLIAFNRQGFEVALHVNTLSRNWTPTELRAFYAKQIPWFRNRLAFAGPPVTHRTHCVTWSDYDTQALVELDHGIRFDTNYYLYPPRWARGGAGHFTGSGLPMRFADRHGEPIDVYQAVTQISDEAEQVLPDAFDELVDAAMGDDQYITVVTVNAHTDFAPSGVSDVVVASAMDRGVPVVSARQMLVWLDARGASWVDELRVDGSLLRFDVRADPDARGLQVLVPAVIGGSMATAVRRAGRDVPLRVETVKGLSYLRVDAVDGSYEVDLVDAPSPTAARRDEAARPGQRAEVIRVRLDEGARDRVITRPVQGGELVLEPGLHGAFDDTTVPSAWQVDGSWAGGPRGGVLSEGSVTTLEEVEPYALDGVAVFSPGGTQRLGFVAPTGESAAFEVGPDGVLEAVVWQAGQRVAVPIAGTWTSSEHRYRIDVEPAGSIRFWIDQSDVALFDARLPERVHVVADAVPGESGNVGELTLQWLSVLPHARQGTLTSSVLDLGRAGRPVRLRWSAVYQQGTTIRAEARRGDAPTPDRTWTSWAPVDAPNRPVPGTGRHVQCRLVLACASAYKTPSLRSVELVVEPS